MNVMQIERALDEAIHRIKQLKYLTPADFKRLYDKAMSIISLLEANL